MRKQLLSLALAALLTPAFNVVAQSDPAISVVWRTGALEDLNAATGFDATLVDWNNFQTPYTNPEKGSSVTRDIAVRKGKLYTVNMHTMSIAEITPDGLKDEWKLPTLASTQYDKVVDGVTFKDYYGTAIGADQAGNFIVGHFFTKAPWSALVWTVYNPDDGTGVTRTLALSDGFENFNVGRLDVIGRVLGDLSQEAVFYLAPGGGNATPAVLPVRVFSGLDTSEGDMYVYPEEKITVNRIAASTVNFAQPMASTIDEYQNKYGEASPAFAYNNGTYYATYVDGTLTSDAIRYLPQTANSGFSGFDTFKLNGKRYYARMSNVNDATFGCVITDENGAVVAKYGDADFTPNSGYGIIECAPQDNGTCDVYLFNGGNGDGAAVKLNFDPSKAGEPVAPVVAGESAENPYKITTPADLVQLVDNPSGLKHLYITLENDIDMKGVAFTPLFAAGAAAPIVHFDGKNHVIKNLSVSDKSGRQASLLGFLKGEVRNLGFIDFQGTVANTSSAWGSSGAIAGYGGFNGVPAVVENCFATGTMVGWLAGGLIGTVTAELDYENHLTVRDCYTNVSIQGCMATSGCGGLVGDVYSGVPWGYTGPAFKPATVEIYNCYAAGDVLGNGTSGVGGLVGGRTGAPNSNLKADNVVCWSNVIKGTRAGAIFSQAEATVTNAKVWDKTLVNGSAVDGAVAASDLQSTVTAWTAFNDRLNDGYPVLAWQEANGEGEIVLQPNGTPEAPFHIASADDLQTWGRLMSPGDTYIVFDNDIDMKDVYYAAPLNDNNFSGVYLHIDGKNHVISNLTVDSSKPYPSLIGVFMGEIRNLGFDNFTIEGQHGNVAAIGSYVGHASYPGTTVVDNVFVKGNITGAGYAGGFGGYCNGDATISNSYFIGEVNALQAGGVYGTLVVPKKNDVFTANSVKVENVYVSGKVSGAKVAGIIGDIPGALVDDVQVADKYELSNVGVISAEIIPSAVDGAEGAPYFTGVAPVMNNCFISEVMIGETAQTDDKPFDDAVAAVVAWPAFGDNVDPVNDLPRLKWETKSASGIDDIVVDQPADADAPAVYYNLQGVQVANPSTGIYIVRRGNKVTKELVR